MIPTYAKNLGISLVEQQLQSGVHGVVLIDRSDVGRIEFTGRDAIDLLHRLSTNNLMKAIPGDVIGTVLTTDKGRIVDYVYVLFKDESLLLLTSPGNEGSFLRWIEKFTITEDIYSKVVTSSTAMISLLGAQARTFAESMFHVSLEPNRFIEAQSDFGTVTTLYREEFGTQYVDLIVDANVASEFKKMLIEANVDLDPEMAHEVYETFRISRAIPAFNHELTGSFNPYEVGLSHAISFNKGCYLGQEVIARLDTYDKVQKGIYNVLFDGADFPEVKSIVKRGNEEAGMLTSVSPQTIRGTRVCLCILKKGLIKVDDNVSVVSGEKMLHGVVRNTPVEA